MSNPFAHVVRISHPRLVKPFHERASESFISNRPLKEHQEDVFRACKLTWTDLKEGENIQGPCILIRDDLFLARDTLNTFLQHLTDEPPTKVPKICALLQNNPYAEQHAPLQKNPSRSTPEGDVWLFGLAAIPESLKWETCEDLFNTLFQDAETIVLDPKEKVHKVPVPEHYFGKDHLEFILTSRPLMHIRHWIHILWANQAMISIPWLELGKFRVAMRVVWAILRAMSINKYKVLGKLNTIGPGCDIHPTALIEGSVLGAGCTIGPYARVRFSVLGEKVNVMAGAQVEFTTLAERSMVSSNCVINYCVSYPQAALSCNVMQLTVLGRRAFTVALSIFLDTNFQRDVRVVLDGEVHDSKQRFIGCALGHDVKIGSGIWVGAGREIPNNTILVRDPKHTALKFPKTTTHDHVLVVRNGVVEPL